jgi:transcriptional regulator
VFVPEMYTPQDPVWITELITGNPLAILATSEPGAWPKATHVPTIPEGKLEPDNLIGSVILGHMNRLNPHWVRIQDGARALLIFQGPHSYVSPTHYQTCPAAPTWNFTSVHVQGSLTVIHGREETLNIVKQTVAAYEGLHGTGWDMSESLGYFQRLLPGVGAFRLVIEKVDSMFKLSQEQKHDVWQRTVDVFAAGHGSRPPALAELMRRARPGGR